MTAMLFPNGCLEQILSNSKIGKLTTQYILEYFLLKKMEIFLFPLEEFVCEVFLCS